MPSHNSAQLKHEIHPWELWVARLELQVWMVKSLEVHAENNCYVLALPNVYDILGGLWI